ncbi:MAG TPA: 16S rRNA (adenine(1518)-N(6)/adenine(1519)-N(6))-dimethyltransferase RsmA [Candidatus Paceibacterota bacterium]|nr:16S rRNA (adenine(1518)-N(6)/adenine(1519)-N(6))-dimethyltransferase RsmA [Candidatus Paceibacterota bacterium]
MFQKKSLGQHFLHSTHYLNMIVDAADIKPGERVLEIGPGDGALTAALIARGAEVVAIEKDSRLIPILQKTFAEDIREKKLSLIEGDALEVGAETLELKDRAYKLVANIPYYITGAIMEKFLSSGVQPSAMTLLVQKEVAERIAREKKESILSLSVKAYGTPIYMHTVPAGAFSPPPKVDSAILSITNISRKNFANANQEKRFFEIVHAGFAHKRKLLGRNLEPLLGKEYSGILQNIGVTENARAEDMPLETWLALSRHQ